MDEITKIEQALKTEDSPTELASYLTRLAAYNSFYSERMKQIQLIKPGKWLEIQSKEEKIDMIQKQFTDVVELPPATYMGLRDKPLSDKKTEMIWATTPEGQEETNLTFILKRLDILYRSISKRLYSMEQEWKQSNSRFN